MLSSGSRSISELKSTPDTGLPRRFYAEAWTLTSADVDRARRKYAAAQLRYAAAQDGTRIKCGSFAGHVVV